MTHRCVASDCWWGPCDLIRLLNTFPESNSWSQMLYPESRWLDANRNRWHRAVRRYNSSCWRSSTKLARDGRSSYRDQSRNLDRSYNEINHIFYSVPHSVRDYYRERALLSLNDGVVTYKLKIVMPPKMRDDALRRLHESHQGISKCRERAASAIWWPGISSDRFIDRCDTFRRNRPTEK